MNNEEKIARILDTLSYAFANPEAKQLMRYIDQKKFDKVESMIKNHLDQEDIEIILAHFKRQVNQTFNLIPVTIEEFYIQYPHSDEVPDVNIVVNYSGEIILTNINTLRSISDNEWIFFHNNDFIKLSNVSQIWLIQNTVL